MAEETSGRNPVDGSDRILTPGEVAKILRVSVQWVRDHTTRYEPIIPAFRLGGQWRYRASELEAFLAGLGINHKNAA